ncbi:HlyD family secretion protein [Shewanella mangrovisoli]|uniref:HlyD family secretion protein n=1 Tax=Shewanella mangrovisoli TaxID=2864211 RepID=A0ABV4VFN8_9GAMM
MSDANPQAPKANTRKKRGILLIVVPLLSVLAIGAVYLHGGRYMETDNAYVKADKVPVSAQVAGNVDSLYVVENQRVEKGQVLFRLDDAMFKVMVDKASAKLAQVKTDLAVLKASYHEKQAEITLAETKLTFAEKEQKRQENLIGKHFVSESQLEDARQNTDIARQNIQTLQKDLHRIAESLGGSPDFPIEQHPSYLEALAQLNEAKLDLSRVEIKAPVSGVVSQLPKLGQYVNVGAIALALVADHALWIEANFTETDLTHVKPGQKVNIHIDTFPDNRWQGTVESLSPATGAEFSLIPAQNATGNWVKIAQRVPVRIAIDTALPEAPLRAGLSAVVDIDTEYQRQLLGFSL